MTTGLLLCLIIVAIWIYQFPTLHQQLREHHAFRQTQTAFQTLSIFEGWGSILRPGMPVLGQPWQVPFEFPLFQQSAAWVMQIFSFEIDFANRFTSLVWFSMCVLLLYHVAHIFVGRFSSLLASIFFSISPLSIQWSRASLIEYCALFFSLLFLYSTLNLLKREKRSVSLAITCLIAAVLGGMIKPTTFVVYLGVVIIAALTFVKSNRTTKVQRQTFLVITLSSLVAFVFMILWNNYTDRVKQQNPFTSFLTSHNVREWQLGTVSQRLDASNWIVILERINSLIIPIWILAFGFLYLLFVKRHRWISVILIAAIIGTISFFFNLYLVHDYYLVAVSPLFALLFSFMIGGLDNSCRFHKVRPWALCLALSVVMYSSITQAGYRQLSRGDLPGFDNELVRLSTQEQRVFIAGHGWDPTTMYYIKRRGIALDERSLDIKVLAAMNDLSQYDFYQGPLWFQDVVRLRGWFAPVGQYTLRLDDEPSAIASNLVIGMDRGYVSGRSSLGNRVILDCRVKQFTSVSIFPSNVQMRMDSYGKNVLTFDNQLANSPTGNVLLLQDTRNTTIPINQFGCDGSGQISITW
jgi:4-amino-4-deoxy-L-arabinose transferase-like glycosyltransferase